MRIGIAAGGAILLGNHLAFSKSMLQYGVIRGMTIRQNAVDTTTCTTLVWQAKITATATTYVPTSTLGSAIKYYNRRDRWGWTNKGWRIGPRETFFHALG
jgi:hypothetical protein